MGQAVFQALRGRVNGARLMALRDCAFAPCRGCQDCLKNGGECVLPPDGADSLFACLQEGKFFLLVAPIYFYALPGQLKMFIDRSQKFWADFEQPRFRLSRKAAVILASGRKNGENLFKGSLLTLKWFLKPFGYELAYEKLLRGVDSWAGRDDLPFAEGQAAGRDIEKILEI